jgi:hypothetical protein
MCCWLHPPTRPIVQGCRLVAERMRFRAPNDHPIHRNSVQPARRRDVVSRRAEPPAGTSRLLTRAVCLCFPGVTLRRPRFPYVDRLRLRGPVAQACSQARRGAAASWLVGCPAVGAEGIGDGWIRGGRGRGAAAPSSFVSFSTGNRVCPRRRCAGARSTAVREPTATGGRRGGSPWYGGARICARKSHRSGDLRA